MKQLIFLVAAVAAQSAPAQTCPPTYCVPSTLECCPNTGTPKEYISNFRFANLNVGTGAPNCTGSGYIDYTSVFTANVAIGSNYAVVVTSAVPRNSGCATFTPFARVWVDWDADGVFATSEATTLAQSGTISSGTITVPPGAAEKTRLRVGVAWPGAPGPCNTGQNGGAFQDFSVVVTGAGTSLVNLCPYGLGLAGGNGVPSIWATRSPVVGESQFAFTVANAATAAPALLMVGVASAAMPIFGGTLLVDVAQAAVVFSVATDNLGQARAGLPIPNSPQLVDSSLYAQWGIADPLAVQGIAMSQGLRAVIRRP